MPFWADIFKTFANAFRADPLSAREDSREVSSVGVISPDSIPDIRGYEGYWSGGKGVIPIRDSHEFIDLSSVTNRQSRYKEYERLRSMAEIETALTIFADEMCVGGQTKVATPFGFMPIEELTRIKKPGERFLVYCFDFNKNDYTLGWAYNPRLVKNASTIRICFDDGSYCDLTPDHKVLLRDATWKCAGDLRQNNELMPFYRIRANQLVTKLKANQFPRIFTLKNSWMHERQFIDEWKVDKKIRKYERLNKIIRYFFAGVGIKQLPRLIGYSLPSLKQTLNSNGFSTHELRYLRNFETTRKIVGIFPHETIPVYDLSVEIHENFATDSIIVHNCQTGENGRMFEIKVKDNKVKEEAEVLLHEILEVEEWLYSCCKNLCLGGDWFGEIVINENNPKAGVLNVQPLPADSMYRIETTKGKLIEFQQSKEGPDYQSLARVEVLKATDPELHQATALRFTPQQIIHMKIGEDRRQFYPYGVSMIEAARGPAHQLRLLEDSLVVYRLCLTGNTRIRTKEGYKYIKDIKEGDIVWTYENKNKVVLSKVIKIMENGIKDVYKVKSQHIEITGTENHPLLVNRDGVIQFVDIKDLRPKKDKLLNVTRDEEIEVEIPKFEKKARFTSKQRKIISINEKKYSLIKSCIDDENLIKNLCTKGKAILSYDKAKLICSVFGLEKNDLIVKNEKKIINLPKYVDEDFARLFGFLIGDGSIGQNKINFSAGEYPDINKKYSDLLEKYFGKVSFYKEKRSDKEELGNYTVCCKTACQVFYDLGYISGAHYKRIPTWVFSAFKKIRKAFIEGLSDADGCERYTRAGLWFSTIELCNKKLVEDIKEVWHSIGLCSGKLGKRKRKGGHKVRHGHIKIGHGHIMKDTTCYSVTITSRELPEFENVWNVKRIGQKKVYDFTVDHPKHNFIACGTISSNSRAPERRIFYIDVGQLPPFKAEAFMDRLKDQFRKKKVHTNKGGGTGSSSVEERWSPPSIDEDIWVPIRPNSNTKIDTLPGASNLDQISDVSYFQNKLYVAMNFPKNYSQQQDPQQTRISLSSQDVKFARLIERLQKSVAKGLKEILIRHLILRGFPEEKFMDVQIKMTPPSDWREISRNEVTEARYNRAAAMKGSQLMSDFDILTNILHVNKDEAKELVARMKQQKLEDLKLQVMGQNPQLLGLGQPPSTEQEIGATAGGPTAAPTPEETPPQETPQIEEKPTSMIPEPTEEDIEKYNLSIRAGGHEEEEEVDTGELGEG